MLQTSFSFNDPSCAIASVGPRPMMARFLAAERTSIALDQSSRAASARRLGNRSSAFRSGRSEAQVPARLNKMATDATNVFVAATLNSCPAAIGKTISQADARGLFVSFTIAVVSAPLSLADDAASLADDAASTRSSLCPD